LHLLSEFLQINQILPYYYDIETCPKEVENDYDEMARDLISLYSFTNQGFVKKSKKSDFIIYCGVFYSQSVVREVKMEAVSSSEMPVRTYQTSRYHNPEDHNINLHCRENLMFYMHM
jgi:hypothetical protein